MAVGKKTGGRDKRGADGGDAGADAEIDRAFDAAQPRMKKRAPGRPFGPGNPGNPGGIPADEQALIRRIKADARRMAPDAIAALHDIAMHGKGEIARVQAATAILDRALGKPAQPLVGDDEGPALRIIVEGAADDGR